MMRPVASGPLFTGHYNQTPNRQIQKPVPGNRHARRAQAKPQQKLHYEPPVADPQETDFRHQHWKDKRDRLLKILPRAGTTQTSFESFLQCGAECYVEHEATEGRYRLRGCYCHNRHCEPCMKAKANLLRGNLVDRLHGRTEFQYRFVTLTLKHTDTPLRDQIDRLYASFKKLRNSKLWKTNQKGGCMILETKWNPDTGEWHPHLHIMAEGEHMMKERLSEEWYAATGDSYVVDIKLMQTDKDAAFYVAKYVSKGTNADVYFNDEACIEYICAMRGTRSCATFGSWRGFKLLAKPTDARKWSTVGSLTGIIKAANANEPWAIKMLDLINAHLQYNPHRPRPAKPLASADKAKYTIPSAKCRH